MAVAAGVVTRHFCAAVITHFQMAPEGRRTAVLDGLHHAALWRADPMRTAIGLAVLAEDVRELQPPRPRLGVRGPAHGSGAGLLRQRQEIERRGRAFQVALRQVEIAHRGRDVPVPEETLDTVEIDPGLQEMSGEGVS
jgi:hypothetical protein